MHDETYWTAVSPQVTAAVIAGSVSAVVALIALIGSAASARRDRRRTLYGEAVRAALSWHEMLYRVRRRRPGPEAAASLVDRFHDLQESLTFHQAWISTESQSIGRSYKRLVRQVKDATESHITAAWTDAVRPAPGNAQVGDSHPDVQDFADQFLSDVRSHLSLQPWRRLMLLIRSSKY